MRALLLNGVIVGRGKKVTIDEPDLAQPPPGYDSVSTLDDFTQRDTDQDPDSCRGVFWRNFEIR